MKIEKVTIHNFKAIKNYKGDLQGRNVYLIGGNGVGKTSFIDAIWYGLDGKAKIPEITTNGAKKGVIELDLGDFIARTKLKKGRRAEFEIENKVYNDETDRFVKAPRTFLEKKIGVLNFDINDFFSKTDAEQVKYFAKVMDADFSDIDSEIEEISESRKFDKRALAEARTKQNYYNEETAAKEYVSVVELSKQIDSENEKSNTYENVKNGVSLREEQIQNKLDEIKEIQAQVDKLRAEATDGYAWLDNEDNKPMPEEEIAVLIETRNKAELINEEIREAKDAKQADETVEKYEASIEEATREIEEQRALKSQRISELINVEGLSYDVDQERFLFNGLPFDKNQTNTAAQLITGMKIASMFLKELKILRVDASLIDKKEFSKVISWAEENEIELFIELVDREATQLQIVVKDGEPEE